MLLKLLPGDLDLTGLFRLKDYCRMNILTVSEYMLSVIKAAAWKPLSTDHTAFGSFQYTIGNVVS